MEVDKDNYAINFKGFCKKLIIYTGNNPTIWKPTEVFPKIKSFYKDTIYAFENEDESEALNAVFIYNNMVR